MVMRLPTLAMWLYGPIGSGVLAGVLVSTSGTALASYSRSSRRRWSFASSASQQMCSLTRRGHRDRSEERGKE
jgi:hypothetical protein